MAASVSPHNLVYESSIIHLTFCLNADISTPLVLPLDNVYDDVVKSQQNYQKINTQEPFSRNFIVYILK